MSFTGLKSAVLCLSLLALPALAADRATTSYMPPADKQPSLLQRLAAALKPKPVHVAAVVHRRPKHGSSMHGVRTSAHGARVRHAAAALRKRKAAPALAAAEPAMAQPAAVTQPVVVAQPVTTAEPVTVGAAVTAPAPLSELELAAKGQQLFNDASLSGGSKASCATCHFSTGHTNNKTYVGLDVVADGDPNGRNTPTLWGVGERSVFGWAGQAATLEDSIRGIIVNRMKGPEPSPETLAALVAYVRTLNYPANWQVKEDGTPRPDASEAIKRGFALYVGDGGCGTCHQLPTFDKKSKDDIGTGGKFKVPTLHAVASTAPYFHDGRTASLRDAVKLMWEVYAKKMESRLPTEAELDDLTAYVGAL
ncbi:cytochrome c peroxidase [Bradyrhizobium sp. STM 3809]|uniref:cytochrome-c peroxidase n=1 Tax=Bradyrhizobium sp. STM 3809 TaxID=551936 RepID=UPI000240986D|nr:cytochrome c peroxidase [Bradyrhizobium sp. STM 3809]CCE01761.1 putative cytochrome c peroxidase [Bradyrhizobium sp. STM 3809]